jgi:hypothetical protein
MNNNK